MTEVESRRFSPLRSNLAAQALGCWRIPAFRGRGGSRCGRDRDGRSRSDRACLWRIADSGEISVQSNANPVKDGAVSSRGKAHRGFQVSPVSRNIACVPLGTSSEISPADRLQPRAYGSSTHWKGRESIQLNTAFQHGAIPADSAGVTVSKIAYGIFKTSNLTFNQVDVRFLRKDVAVAHAFNELQGDVRTKDTRRTLLVMILTKENGRWLVAVAQNTEINRPLALNR
jgi:hypothetical protein